MFNVYNPYDWYWLADDGRVFSSKRALTVTTNDTAYKAFISPGRSATVWPRDDSGNQTSSSLDAVLSIYGLTGPS